MDFPSNVLKMTNLKTLNLGNNDLVSTLFILIRAIYPLNYLYWKIWLELIWRGIHLRP